MVGGAGTIVVAVLVVQIAQRSADSNPIPIVVPVLVATPLQIDRGPPPD